MARLLDLDLTGENDVALTEFRRIEEVIDRLQRRHRLRVTSRNEPIGVLIDIPTALALEEQYAELTSAVEHLQAVVRKLTDRADDEALAALCRERLTDEHLAGVVPGPEGADDFLRLYDEAEAARQRADSR
jgi:prevent-host-death family protein